MAKHKAIIPRHTDLPTDNPDTPIRCHAHNRKGGQCGNRAVPGRRVCRFHGGMSPVGAAHPRFKHGRYSKYLPARLAPAYIQASQDSELLSLRDDIALVESRIGELLQLLHSDSESRNLFEELSSLVVSLSESVQAEEWSQVGEGVARLGEVVQAGGRAFSLWDDIFKSLEVKRKLSDSERERLMDMNALITSEQAFLLVGALLESVTRNVQDNATRFAIEREFTRLVGAVRLERTEAG